MAKHGNIERSTLEEMTSAVVRGEGRMDYTKIAATTEEEIEAQAAEDEEDFPKGWELEATIMTLPPRKSPVNLRVDSDVLEWFKNSGKGYQTRMNNVLRAFMKAAAPRG